MSIVEGINRSKLEEIAKVLTNSDYFTQVTLLCFNLATIEDVRRAVGKELGRPQIQKHFKTVFGDGFRRYDLVLRKFIRQGEGRVELVDVVFNMLLFRLDELLDGTYIPKLLMILLPISLHEVGEVCKRALREYVRLIRLGGLKDDRFSL